MDDSILKKRSAWYALRTERKMKLEKQRAERSLFLLNPDSDPSSDFLQRLRDYYEGSPLYYNQEVNPESRTVFTPILIYHENQDPHAQESSKKPPTQRSSNIAASDKQGNVFSLTARERNAEEYTSGDVSTANKNGESVGHTSLFETQVAAYTANSEPLVEEKSEDDEKMCDVVNCCAPTNLTEARNSPHLSPKRSAFRRIIPRTSAFRPYRPKTNPFFNLQLKSYIPTDNKHSHLDTEENSNVYIQHTNNSLFQTDAVSSPVYSLTNLCSLPQHSLLQDYSSLITRQSTLSDVVNDLMITSSHHITSYSNEYSHVLGHYTSSIHEQEARRSYLTDLVSFGSAVDMRKRHTLQCAFCGIACSSQGKLKNHLRIHFGEKPHKCECGRAFARNEELTRHQRIHTGHRPHRCQVCGKAFGRKDHLNKHRNTHLQTSEKKMHICEVTGCIQRYTRSDALARHQWAAHGIKAKVSKWRPMNL